jgi:uncharacterized protein
MKYFLFSFLCVLSLTGFSQKSKDDPFYKPRPKTFIPVNDFAGMLSKEESASLTKKIVQYRDSSTNVIVIITQQTLKDPVSGKIYQLEEAAKHYANNWGIGLKEKNNGVLIFVVRDDRKIRIATGTGIENVLTNLDCRQIINDNIVPEFKKNNYYRGLDTAVDQIMQILSPGSYRAANEPAVATDSPQPASQSYSYDSIASTKDDSTVPFIIFVVLIIAVVLVIAKKFGGKDKADTVYNATGSSRPSFSRGRGLTWFFPGLFVSSFFNNRNYHSNNNSSGNDNNFNSSSSDNFSSSSFDSSGSSSFDSGSSFGGGDSDGGGASGSW